MGIWYTTREDVKAALDVRETARSNTQIDRAIESSSRSIDGYAPGGGLLHRRFYPELRTQTFDWPNEQHAESWRLWLDANELISATTITSGGVTLAPSDYLLRPDHGPPYTHVEINLAGSASFGSGASHQRSISILGLFGHSAQEEPAGATGEALDASETAVDVTDSAAIGVGHILRVDTERMIVTGRRMADTDETLGWDLTASAADVIVSVADGTAFATDEVLLIDAERMLIVDIADNTLIVKRAWDGSALTTHDGGATIYASRTLIVSRGALGTTAATHLTAAPLYRHVVPGGVGELCLAETLNTLLQRASGYGRVVGSGDNEREASGRGLRDIRDQAITSYGRKARIRSV